MVALRNLENPCLVGDAGSGKTQVAELCSVVLNIPFVTLNLHKNTDVSDLIGQVRPIRNRSEIALQLEMYEQMLLDAPQQKFFIQRI